MFNGALPAGNIDAAHVPLLLARAVWLVGLLSATGALLFRAFAQQYEVSLGGTLGKMLADLAAIAN